MTFGDLLYGPHYDLNGTDAVITIDSATVTVKAIDRTAGVAVAVDGEFDVQTIKPAATVRVADLTAAGVERSDLAGSSMTMNGKTWRIEAAAPRPSPDGEADGELLLLLIETGW